MARIGIKDVAEAAGVSVTTVSHALNGKGRLPVETRERVQRVARDLGYRPSSTARNLVGGRTGLIGLTVSQAQGRYGEAEALSQRALALTERVLGPEHPDTAAVRENYAILLRHRSHEVAHIDATNPSG